MAMQLSVAARNALLDAIETAAGTSTKLLLFSGAVAANCAAADPTGLLATISLPSDWMANASAGAKALTGSWAGTASASGTAISFRIKDTSLTNCHIQGTVGLGSGDLSLDNNVLANAQNITVTSFNLTAPNA